MVWFMISIKAFSSNFTFADHQKVVPNFAASSLQIDNARPPYYRYTKINTEPPRAQTEGDDAMKMYLLTMALLMAGASRAEDFEARLSEAIADLGSYMQAQIEDPAAFWSDAPVFGEERFSDGPLRSRLMDLYGAVDALRDEGSPKMGWRTLRHAISSRPTGQ